MDNFERVVFAGLRALVGGEIIEYTKMLVQAREQAIDRVVEEATRSGRTRPDVFGSRLRRSWSARPNCWRMAPRSGSDPGPSKFHLRDLGKGAT